MTCAEAVVVILAIGPLSTYAGALVGRRCPYLLHAHGRTRRHGSHH